MEDKFTFKVTDDEGKEIECQALFSFEAEETGKNYMVYTDNTNDEEGNVKVYAAIYEPEVDEGLLKPIETDEEWEIVQKALESFQSEEQEEGDEL